MRMPKIAISAISAVAVLLSGSLVAPSIVIAGDASAVEEGQKIAFHRKKGNCLACHAIKGGKLPGNIGPPLENMQQRFPDKSKLKAQIWDATVANPYSIMPPFGKYKILSDKELDEVVEFIYSL